MGLGSVDVRRAALGSAPGMSGENGGSDNENLRTTLSPFLSEACSGGGASHATYRDKMPQEASYSDPGHTKPSAGAGLSRVWAW